MTAHLFLVETEEGEVMGDKAWWIHTLHAFISPDRGPIFGNISSPAAFLQRRPEVIRTEYDHKLQDVASTKQPAPAEAESFTPVMFRGKPDKLWKSIRVIKTLLSITQPAFLILVWFVVLVMSAKYNMKHNCFFKYLLLNKLTQAPAVVSWI